MTKDELFKIISRYNNTNYYTNEINGYEEEDWYSCKIHSFDLTDKLINVFHPKTGKIVTLNPLNTDGFLILNRIGSMSDDDAIDLACSFMKWKEEYVFLSGKDKERIIIQNSMYEYLEFNIGLENDNGRFWCINIETSMIKNLEDPFSGINKLMDMNYGFDWMFDGFEIIAIESEELLI